MVSDEVSDRKQQQKFPPYPETIFKEGYFGHQLCKYIIYISNVTSKGCFRFKSVSTQRYVLDYLINSLPISSHKEGLQVINVTVELRYIWRHIWEPK